MQVRQHSWVGDEGEAEVSLNRLKLKEEENKGGSMERLDVPL